MQSALDDARELDRATATHADYDAAVADLQTAYDDLVEVFHTALSVPASVDPGNPATITGSGFAPNETVTFSWTQIPALTAAWTATANANGAVSTQVTLPRASANGSYTLSAEGSVSATPATATVVVSAVMLGSQTSFVAVPAALSTEDVLTVQVGVTAGATGTVQLFDGAAQLATATLDGNSRATLTGGNLTAGSHSITARYLGDAWYSSSVTTAATVTVTAPPVIDPAMIVPASVDPGTPATITGSGFAPNETVTFSWTQAPALTDEWTATADASGAVSTQVTLPRDTANGSYTLSAVGSVSATPITATVVVSAVMLASETAFLAVPAELSTEDALTVKVSVTAGATGTVELFDGTQSLATATLDGESIATLNGGKLSAGSHTLTVQYSGDDWYANSVTGAVTVKVIAPSVPEPEEEVKVSVPVLSKASQAYQSVTAKRATISATVTGATSGTVTFRTGTKTLGAAEVVKSGSEYTATLRLPAKLKIGSYAKLTATLVTGKATVTSTASGATFKVVKATTAKVKVKVKKFASGTKPKVTVKVATLSNGRKAVGKVKITIGKKVVKTVKLKAKNKGKVTVKLPKRYSKTIKVKAKFVPKNAKFVKAKKSKTVKVKTVK